jgi:hypothetical protein
VNPLASTSDTAVRRVQTFRKETLVKGQPARIRCLELGGQTYEVTRTLVTTVGLEDEWYEDVRDPETIIATLRDGPGFRPDLFTFWQRLPDLEPKYPYHVEWQEIAALPIQSYHYWWNHQIKARTRNVIRKAEKEGVQVREVAYDDDFVRGMTAIFNESPVRQGRAFWHYGKDFATVKQQFSRYIVRETMIGAYLGQELIGFIMLGNAGRFALTGQIISAINHRDKSPTNALIAKAVELCDKKKLSYLVYYFWSDDSLGDFKRHSGFERIRIPRYFVPLTRKGELALKLGMHRGWKELLPKEVMRSLKRLRRRWYDMKGA